MVHLDLVAERVTGIPGSIVGDIAKIPTSESRFDVVLCVGSVLNYGNPILAFQEFWRVMKPGGILVLEYERSGSPDHWINHGFEAPCVLATTFYGSLKTDLWVYGDQFIDGLIATTGFKVLLEKRFHCLSSLVLAVTGTPTLATRCVYGDSLFARIWPIRKLASNRFLAVEKPT